MSTALAAQLAQLAAVQSAQERYVKGKPSLLFDYHKAADVSVEQILNIARTGTWSAGAGLYQVYVSIAIAFSCNRGWRPPAQSPGQQQQQIFGRLLCLAHVVALGDYEQISRLVAGSSYCMRVCCVSWWLLLFWVRAG